jgi:hypothetical protein
MRNWGAGLFAVWVGCLSVGCATTAAPVTAPAGWQPVFTATEKEASILFDARVLAPGREISSVTLVGTFNSWGTGTPLALRRQEDGTWRETFPRTLLGVPGNSGTTEFQFILDGRDRMGGAVAPEGQRFGNNFVILWPGITEATIAYRDAQNRILKTHYDSEAELTNFRELAGGRLAPGRLYRSYHPFIPSRNGPIEQARLEGVQKLMEEKKVAAVINLSDEAEVLNSDSPPAYYKNLATQGQVLFAPTHYNVVYFGPAGAEFTAELNQVLSFMAKTPGPYLIHCRLGTDRTGVVSAILQALAGVPWSAILADFQQSNSLGIEEYRAPELLTYSIEQFLGRSPESIPEQELSASVRARLEQKGLGHATLDQVLKHLTP